MLLANSRQSGDSPQAPGKRWHVIFQRKQLSKQADFMLQEIKNAKPESSDTLQ